MKSKKKFNRVFWVSTQKKLFRPTVVSITDGQQVIQFNGEGTFAIKTEKQYPIPLLQFRKTDET